jgi:hypothetical protein
LLSHLRSCERYDEPETLPSSIGQFRLTSADGGQLIDRVIADKMLICGAHFPFPGAGVFAKDGNAYTFTPVVQS